MSFWERVKGLGRQDFKCPDHEEVVEHFKIGDIMVENSLASIC